VVNQVELLLQEDAADAAGILIRPITAMPETASTGKRWNHHQSLILLKFPLRVNLVDATDVVVAIILLTPVMQKPQTMVLVFKLNRYVGITAILNPANQLNWLPSGSSYKLCMKYK
jgi:hypothetical protein